ncbi:MAG: aminotransferase class I/II-fold pyridoxal phosphate-dependent enzyme [Candidatus Woesearchaeota archaeon]
MADLRKMINPLGPSIKVQEELREHLGYIHQYSEPSEKLILRIAKKNEVNINQVMITDGADGALTLIAQSIFKNYIITIPQPCFHRYKDYPSYFNVKYKLIKPKDSLLVDEIEVLKTEGDILLLASPNNPTGFKISNEFLFKALIKFKVVVLDETLLLTFKGKQNLINNFSNLIIVRSFSKLFGLAGLRIGYIIASNNNIQKIKMVSTPFKVNYLAQVAALSVLNDENYYEHTKDFIKRERNRLYQALNDKNIKNSDSLCYCLKLNKKQQLKLEEEKVLVQKDMGFGYGQDKEFLFRLTIGAVEDNSKLIEILKEGDNNEQSPN